MLYWYLLSPIHELMFRGMLRRIAAAAARQEQDSSRRLAVRAEIKQ